MTCMYTVKYELKNNVQYVCIYSTVFTYVVHCCLGMFSVLHVCILYLQCVWYVHCIGYEDMQGALVKKIHI